MSRTPSFCPNPLCPLHDPSRAAQASRAERRCWYLRKGWRINARSHRIQRYQCRKCRRYFSDRTFHIDYWGKRHLDYHRLLGMFSSCMGLRAMARAFHCSPKTVENKLARLTRQAIAVHALLIEGRGLQEDLAADGFESFTVSQYFPNNFNLLVGKDSQFLYTFNYVQLRRKGRMTDTQKRRAAGLRKSVPIAGGQMITRFAELTGEALRMQRRSPVRTELCIHTDEKAEYARELSAARFGYREPGRGCRVKHLRTSGRKHRNLTNPLFSVNYLDREIRKDLAEHVRETTRFGRNVNSAVGRMALYLFYHNYLKPYRLNRQAQEHRTHAEAAGIERESIDRLLGRWMSRRYFRTHLHLDLHWEKVWRRAYSTPGKLFTDRIARYVFV